MEYKFNNILYWKGRNKQLKYKDLIDIVQNPNEYRNRRNLIGKKITIEDNAWIGSNAVILPGVKLGKGSVVGAGTVVKKDVLENEVVGGVPAKHIKYVDNKGE